MLLELDRVSKRFGAVTAVDALSCTIAEGEVLGIMGPNGAGKTTLLDLIMGAVPLDAGAICFGGERITGLTVSSICQRGIGRTYQIPQPFTQMSVLENLLVGALYGSRRQSMKAAQAHAYERLAQVGLLEKAGTPAGALGLLERKRLELARALSLRPRLLLLDEIAGGLVESEVEDLKGILHDLKRAGLSMLIIEHVLGLLFDLSDRLLVMDFGRCIAQGSPADVLGDSRVIHAYLGTARTGGGPPSGPEKPAELALASSPPVAELANQGEAPQRQGVPTGQAADMPGESPAHLSMSHVSAAYGDFQALFDVSLELFEGEIVALIGLNGAGKTTLIRALTRQLLLAKGDILWRGKSIAQKQPYQLAALGIAQCIEGRKIFPELTVLENLELGASGKHARQMRGETLKHVYDLFPILFERRDRPGNTLSGGQQQMLAIGRALMARPELIIFDEISLGLAPGIIDTMYRAIRAINAQGVTILLVEQSIERSLDIARRAYVIERGHIVLSETTESVKQDPGFRQLYFGLKAEASFPKHERSVLR